MRTLRDVVAWKHFDAKDMECDDMEPALKNMQEALQYCKFWKPMPFAELEQHVVQSSFEVTLVSQIQERAMEIAAYIEGDSMQKYAGLPLEGIAGGSSLG